MIELSMPLSASGDRGAPSRDVTVVAVDADRDLIASGNRNRLVERKERLGKVCGAAVAGDVAHADIASKRRHEAPAQAMRDSVAMDRRHCRTTEMK